MSAQAIAELVPDGSVIVVWPKLLLANSIIAKSRKKPTTLDLRAILSARSVNLYVRWIPYFYNCSAHVKPTH
jgi:hypothetical protein